VEYFNRLGRYEKCRAGHLGHLLRAGLTPARFKLTTRLVEGYFLSETDSSNNGREEAPPRSGSKARGIVHILVERCKGCGFCVEFCPRGVLVVSERFNSKGYHPPDVIAPDACTGCHLCELLCPDFALGIEEIAASKPKRSDSKPKAKHSEEKSETKPEQEPKGPAEVSRAS
jgi:2-oxoglutarate ferredoxin oxidoreductase subunit delta